MAYHVMQDGLWPTPELAEKARRLYTQYGLEPEVLCERFGWTPDILNKVLRPVRLGTGGLRKRITRSQVREARRLRASGLSRPKIAKVVGVSVSSVDKIFAGEYDDLLEGTE